MRMPSGPDKGMDYVFMEQKVRADAYSVPFPAVYSRCNSPMLNINNLSALESDAIASATRETFDI